MTIASITFWDNFTTWKDRFNQVVNEINSLSSSSSTTPSTNTISSGATTFGPPVDVNFPSEEVLLVNTDYAFVNGVLSNGTYLGQKQTIFCEATQNATAVGLDKITNSNLIVPLNANSVIASQDQFIKIIWNGSKWLIESYDASIF